MESEHAKVTFHLRDFIRTTLSSAGFSRLGNIMARVRMIYLFDLARRLGALVCGSRTEPSSIWDTSPASVTTHRIWSPSGVCIKRRSGSLRALNLPQQIIRQAPTAGLWEGQTDEDELGFSYREADAVLFHYFDEHLTVDDIVTKGLPRNILVKVLERVASNEFKHHLPYVYAGNEEGIV